MADSTVEILNAAEAEQLLAISKAEVMTQVEVANKFPRSVKASVQNALTLATLDIETAQSCFYKVPMAGGFIEGPSIRLAEIMLSAWRNTMVGAKITGETDSHVITASFCWDMETNVKIGIEYKQKVTNKKGERFSPDVVTNLTNAAVSKAIRNAIFRVVPRSYVNKVERECRRVAVGDQRTLAENRVRWMQWFQKAGISEERVLSKLGKPSIEDLDLSDLETLVGTATSLREGHTKIDDVFPETVVEGTQSFGKNKAKAPPAEKSAKGRTKRKAKAAEEEAPPAQPVNQSPESSPDKRTCGNCGAACPIKAKGCYSCGTMWSDIESTDTEAPLEQKGPVPDGKQVCFNCGSWCDNSDASCGNCGSTFAPEPPPADDDGQGGFGFA